ncbi:hypothetical protein [Defluviitalea phaphyphila]|uniref:hypothetical protein n=1 Tax=Defluviitalea phaphyphila TaxID=1473580 RepID=UPI0007311980|nr:hypothetical protein [Defluviitalea phaphyphila]
MPKNYKQDRSCYNEKQQQMKQTENQQPMMQQPAMQQPIMQQPMMQHGMYPGICQMNMYEYMCDMNERDLEHIKKMHSDLNKKIQRHIECECDRMDYEGSPIYDEYLDNNIIEQIVDRVYERIVNEMPEILEEEDMDRQRIPRSRLVRSLAGALLLTEIYGRRQKYRRRYPYYGTPYYGNYYYQTPYYGYPYSYY